MSTNIQAVVDAKRCYGCGACFQGCPTQAIAMQQGRDGFVVPKIDSDHCIECGKCLKVCPAQQQPELYPVQKVYAARWKDETKRQNSTSGGVFAALASQVLSQGGYVCGAAYMEDLSVRHIVVHDLAGLARLQGSKYTQSDSYSSLAEVKDLVLSGSAVLYSGTGCQVAALRNALGRDYQNLITVEMVCHGVASPGLFARYLEWLGRKKKKKVSGFRFRTKALRPTGEHWKFCYTLLGDPAPHYEFAYSDPYYGSFLQGKTLRNCCYTCAFKQEERVADFTLGDFWGIEKQSKRISTVGGLNLVLVNSQKAEQWFEAIRKQLQVYSSDLRYAKYNPSLTSCASMPEKPLTEIDTPNLFDRILLPDKGVKRWVKNRIPWRLKVLLKKL